MKTAVIGVGRMGRRHVKAVQNLKLDLIGVFDRNQTSLNAAESECQLSPHQLFSSVDSLFSLHPECVIVSTTAPSHAQYVELAIANGARFVVCEKPMAVSLEECDRVLALCDHNKVRLAVNHPIRFMELFSRAKSLVETSDFGGVTSVNVVGGNFGLAMNGSHYFELFRYMTNEMPNRVWAWFSDGVVPNPRGPNFEDRAGSIRLATPKGRRFYMEAGADQGHGLKILFGCPFGQVLVDEFSGHIYKTCRKTEFQSSPSSRYGMPGIDEVEKINTPDVIFCAQSVLAALLKGENFPTGDEGRLAVSILVASYKSHENGNIPVTLDSSLPRDRVFPWA